MFARLQTTEIKKLSQAKASGLAVLVYTILSAHDWKRDSGEVFPSLERISNFLGGAYHRNSIYKALKWLEDQGFIIRSKRTSKSRFKLVLRAVKETAKKAWKGESPDGERNSPEGIHNRKQNPKKNTSYSLNRRKRKRGNSPNYQAPEHQFPRGDKAIGWCCRMVYWLNNGSSPDSMPDKWTGGINAVKEALSSQIWGFQKFGDQILCVAAQHGVGRQAAGSTQ